MHVTQQAMDAMRLTINRLLSHYGTTIKPSVQAWILQASKIEFHRNMATLESAKQAATMFVYQQPLTEVNYLDMISKTWGMLVPDIDVVIRETAKLVVLNILPDEPEIPVDAVVTTFRRYPIMMVLFYLQHSYVFGGVNETTGAR